MFLCITIEQSKKESKKVILVIVKSKRTKYIRINLTKEVKDLYTEKHKTLLKNKLKKTQTNENASHVHRQEDL